MRSFPQAALSRPARGCVSATAIIWGCSTGMLAISLLLSTSAQSEMVIAIVSAAAVNTMTVWLSARNSTVMQTEAQA